MSRVESLLWLDTSLSFSKARLPVVAGAWRRKLLDRLVCLVTGVVLTLAMASGESRAQQPDVIGALKAENAELAAQDAAVTAAVAVASSDLAGLRETRARIEARMQRLERRAEVHALGKEFARMLVNQLRELPRSAQFDVSQKARIEQLMAASDANLRTEYALRELDDLDEATARRLADARGPANLQQRPGVEAAVRAALSEQRDLLGRLSERQNTLISTLREVEEAERQAALANQHAKAKLTQTLYWIPAPPSTQTFAELWPALGWTVSTANWSEAARILRAQAARDRWQSTFALLIVALLLVFRPRLRRALAALSSTAVGQRRYRIRHALGALACAAGLALPGPLLLWFAAMLLQTAPDPPLFVLALGEALSVVSRLMLALGAFVWLLDDNVAVSHFGRDPEAMRFAGRALGRFSALFVPLMFIGALNGLNYAPWANRESLGRLCFVVAMVATAAFLAYLLRRCGPLMQGLVKQSPRSLAVGLHGFWANALAALPLVVAALAAAGYFVVAGYFFGRMLMTLFVVLGAVVLYGLMALWVQLQRAHLAHLRQQEAARATVPEADEPGREAADLPPPRLDIAAIGEQTRSLLDLLVTLLLLGALWWVWKDALPNFAVVGDYALWTVQESVDGVAVERRLTVNSLLLAAIAIAVIWVLVRNVGALLDIALLQRFDMQADATYAIKVIARYAIAAAGVLLVSRILGIAWSDAQWLIAALGVGLGFGLQEIVANFVSGLIVLTERPVRVGDVVTVGDITGTVSGIRARSTRVIDFDNKEVIIPNKAFITERVINWTLANQTTRLLLPIGVAYGNDIARVQQILLNAVRSNADVLTTPSPSVFFIGFGDSSLDFEIRAYVDSFDKRLRVRHEVYVAAGRALDESGIEIPFPQRDLHIRSAPALAEVLPRPPAG